jgi:4a-hydroxytetrahydrobiopterin dehydratase
MPQAPLLSPGEVQERLEPLQGWELEGDRIKKLFRFPAFMDGIAFINRVADLAEAADHHPDVTINYTRITLALITHASHGLTHKDFDLAAQIEGLGAPGGR